MRVTAFISAALTLAVTSWAAAAMAQATGSGYGGINYGGYGQSGTGGMYGTSTTPGTMPSSYSQSTTTYGTTQTGYGQAGTGQSGSTYSAAQPGYGQAAGGYGAAPQYTPYSVGGNTYSGTGVNSGLSGQVSADQMASEGGYWQANDRMWGQIREKTLTMEPGRGQFSINSVGINDAVKLTLVNPTNVPMRFETTKRLGTEVSVLVPPNSQQTVQFAFNKPLSDEIEFLVYQDPNAAIAQINANLAARQAAMMPAPAPQPQVYQQQTSSMTGVEQIQPQTAPVQRQSAVRGYW